MATTEYQDVGLLLGAVEIGVLVSMMLFGMTTVQAYEYSRRFTNDPRYMKITVSLLWLLELGHSISICHTLYEITISQYGRPWSMLNNLPNSLSVAVLLSGFIGPMEQTWFAYRIYKFSGSAILPLFCEALAIFRLGGSFGIAVIGIQGPDLETYKRRVSWLLVAVLTVGAITDIVLAAALCFYLISKRGEGFRRTTRLVERIMRWAIETGVVTSVGALSVLIAFLVGPNTFVWIGLFTILSRLFSNSFLASLNARPRFARLWQEELVQQSVSSGRESIPHHSISRQPRLDLSRIEIPLTPTKEELFPSQDSATPKLSPLSPVYHAV